MNLGVEKIYMKNHYVLVPFKDFTDFMNYMRLSKSVYVRSMNKVMPCKFFLNWAWMKSKRFAQMFMDGEFYPVISRQEYMKQNIRHVLAQQAHNNWVEHQIRAKRRRGMRSRYRYI